MVTSIRLAEFIFKADSKVSGLRRQTKQNICSFSSLGLFLGHRHVRGLPGLPRCVVGVSSRTENRSAGVAETGAVTSLPVSGGGSSTWSTWRLRVNLRGRLADRASGTWGRSSGTGTGRRPTCSPPRWVPLGRRTEYR